MKVNVKITADILRKSARCSYVKDQKIDDSSRTLIGQNCAIGKAIFDLLGSISWVFTDTIGIFPQGIQFEPSGNLLCTQITNIKLPDEASDFIKEFDSKTPNERILMKPFDFVIDVPDEVIELISIGEVCRVLSESKTLEHVNV